VLHPMQVVRMQHQKLLLVTMRNAAQERSKATVAEEEKQGEINRRMKHVV
jgi:hypothetical protein